MPRTKQTPRKQTLGRVEAPQVARKHVAAPTRSSPRPSSNLTEEARRSPEYNGQLHSEAESVEERDIPSAQATPKVPRSSASRTISRRTDRFQPLQRQKQAVHGISS
ncbi:hypothetical protein RvY_02106 [Ramazzottius varieornatus]|uniref:Uncharacterized protein n=1 Tax=Ramazzottius varieornatus TaxID=947166 RepID=A0A1D1UIM6_RAMVA|nr:hypothetical protein RvY_02106 [Ramazzottius varieornatus]